jgi:hypothetical protein
MALRDFCDDLHMPKYKQTMDAEGPVFYLGGKIYCAICGNEIKPHAETKDGKKVWIRKCKTCAEQDGAYLQLVAAFEKLYKAESELQAAKMEIVKRSVGTYKHLRNELALERKDWDNKVDNAVHDMFESDAVASYFGLDHESDEGCEATNVRPTPEPVPTGVRYRDQKIIDAHEYSEEDCGDR